MNCKKLVACFVFALLFPVLAQAQDEDYGEQDHPLNVEYSTENFQVDYFNYQMELLLSQESRQDEFAVSPYYFQAELAQAMQGGWSFGEIYEAMTFSMFGKDGGTSAFYGCVLGFAIAAGTLSMFTGPAAPATFFTGATSGFILCAMRHL